MIRPAPRARAGITLTEILISLLIMGVGMVSLATLFPLGLLRLREALRSSRSAYLVESSRDDVGARDLLHPKTFRLCYWYNPPFSGAGAPYGYNPWFNDPWNLTAGINRGGGVGQGVPVMYDPLWRYASNQPPLPLPAASSVATSLAELRFGAGLGFVRPDPDGNTASAYGLQRITNFLPGNPNGIDENGNGTVDEIVGGVYPEDFFWPFHYLPTLTPTAASLLIDVCADTFASPDDIVMQTEGDNATLKAGVGSPVLPDLSGGSAVNEWAYTWAFTGQMASSGSLNTITGSVVVFHNRPFGIETITSPIDNTTQVPVPTGEQTFEAVFGYSSTVLPAGSKGYAVGYGAKRTVLLRWPATMPDPDIKPGQFIADVTYERQKAISFSRTYGAGALGRPGPFPYQRCHWYQIVKRTPAEPSVFAGDPSGVQFRQMTVTTKSDLMSQTVLDGSASPPQPVHVNVAVWIPSVVAVYDQTYTTH